MNATELTATTHGEAYDREIIRYYNGMDNPVHQVSAAQLLASLREGFQTEGHILREVALAVQETVRGRHVLEVACGHGRWSIFAAETAERIIATDASSNLLSVARQIATEAGLPQQKLNYVEADAFQIDAAVPGMFDGALVMNFLQHIPEARRGEFFAGLHRKLMPGAVVFIGGNQLTATTRAALYQKPGSPDLYERRTRPDGHVYEIIDNIFDELALRTLVEPMAVDFDITMGERWWWLQYAIA